MNHPAELPRSDIFKGIEWLGPRIPYPVEHVRGDTFPITWAKDGELYASAGDPLWGKGLPFSAGVKQDPRMHGLDVERFSGLPPDYRIDKVNEMLNYTGWGGDGVKPSGMISVRGTLYLAAQNLLGRKPPVHGAASQHGSDAFVVQSTDCGRTWSPDIREYEQEGPMFSGARFGGPAFVQYGQDCAAPDGFVYAVSTDQWDNGSELRVGRAPAAKVLDASAWEFVAGVDKSNQPRWTRRLDESASVLTIDRSISLPEMVWLAHAKRYLLLTWRLHADFSPDLGSVLIVLESPEPWGPFRLVFVEDKWGAGEASFYCPRVPLKWFDAKTGEGWLLYSGSWGTTPPPFYRANVRKFRLV